MPDLSPVDPLEADCARVLGFASGAGAEYCAAAAREFLALWRFVTGLDALEPAKQATLDRAAVELAVGQERARAVGVIRARQDELMHNGDKAGNGFIRLNELALVLDRIEGR
jgi:hypothetical protein